MSFLSPWMLFGLLGALVPIAIHLQGRRKAKVVPFAALDFLIGTDKRVAKRLVLRQVLQLIVRIIICVIAALILAKPYTSCRSNGPVVGRGPQAVVLIVDDSAAAGSVIAGSTMLQRSIVSAVDLVKQLGPEAEVALLTTTDGQGELTRDHMALRARLRDMTLVSETPDASRALHRAQQLLAGSNHQSRSVFLFGSPTRALLPDDLHFDSEGMQLAIIDPARGATLNNNAVTDLQILPDPSIGRRSATVVAEVANFSDTATTAKLRLQVGDKVVARGELNVPPGQRARKQFSVNLDDQPHTAEVSVRLEPDALAADNVRYVVADTRDQVSVLLVNGDPHTVRHEDELYYLEAALRPGDRSESGTSVKVCTPDSLSDIDLNGFDVVVLANVRALPTATVVGLSTWVQAGGGLLVAMGDQVDADLYNSQMLPLLAQSLRSPLDLHGGRKQGAGGRLHLSKIEIDHPIFAIFTSDAPGLYNASFTQVMLLGPTTQVRDRRVLARYDNGAAALVEAREGAGHLLLFSSTLDRDWNDLAIHPGYLPLMQQSLRYLASKPYQRKNQQITVGDAVVLKVSANDERIEVRGPGKTRIVLEGEKLRGRSTTRLDRIKLPGFYKVDGVDDDGRARERPDASFAANLSPDISDLRKASSTILSRFSSDSSGTSEQKARPARRVELWHGIAAALLLFLLLESTLSVYGGRRKAR